MIVTEIYEKYKIPVNIQDHQLRVASVAKILVENDSRNFDQDTIISSCLLHDMGNVIKADLTIAEKYLQPEGKSHWNRLQKEFIEKYGDNEDIATGKIAKELKIDKKILEVLAIFKYNDNPKTKLDNTTNLCVYADARVAPYGVVSTNERMEDGKNRYLYRIDRDYDIKHFENLKKKWVIREKAIFKFNKLKPNEITDESIKSSFEELKNYKVQTRGV